LEKLKIALLLGTTRTGANSEIYAQLVRRIGEEREDIDLVYVDPKALNLPGDGANDEDKDPVYSKVTAEADGFFIVTPEYNHSFSGSLKRMLDSEYANYRRKPVVTAGVSSGPFGGVRAIKALLPVVQRLGMVPCFVEVPNPNINSVINEDKTITDDATIEKINKAFDELIWFAGALKSAE